MKKLAVLAVLLLALILGIFTGVKHAQKKNYAENQSSTIFSPPQEIAAFSLVDTKGRVFNNNTLWGHWSFLFFGFTQCKETCPLAMNHLKQVYQILLEEKQHPMPQIVFISVDPVHDTLKKLGEYVQVYDPHFQGATGDPLELEKLAASLNIFYAKNPASQNNSALIDHSGAILLIEPNGKLAAIFSTPHDPAAIAKDFQMIVDNTG